MLSAAGVEFPEAAASRGGLVPRWRRPALLVAEVRVHLDDGESFELLPFVDAKRIAFYGLSYGGETAVRVPPLLDGYCLSICSGDFNDWARKVAATKRAPAKKAPAKRAPAKRAPAKRAAAKKATAPSAPSRSRAPRR